jgi:cobalt-zinc-cadmium efflux system membrane fusion protein
MNHRLALAVCAVFLAVTVGCKQGTKPASKKTEPAAVAHHVTEDSLNTITLTEQAEQRLGIQLANVQLLDVRQKRTLGGEVVIPPGQTVVVSAPVAGTLSAPANGETPAPGSVLSAGQAIYRFAPLLSAERDVLTPAERVGVAQTRADVATAKMEAERLIESAKLEVEAAQLAYDRAAHLLEIKAGSRQTVEEAETRLKLAKESQATAELRHQFLKDIELDEQAGELAVRSIVSPVAGILQDIPTAVGETVAAGETLFSVIQTDTLWIRVPVYVGHRREIDTGQPAMIAEYGQSSAIPPRQGTYVSAPPSANPVAATVDLFYKLGNVAGDLNPGQRLAVTLPAKSNEASLIVPFHAILHDIHGGTWVYERVDDHVYARSRVELKYVDGENAVLARGPQVGTQVVTDGAVELFGTEFGVGH